MSINFKEICENNDIEQVISYLNTGGDVNYIDNYSKTILMYACEYGCKDIVQLLIDNETSINLLDDKGNTALIYACREGHKEIVELLINNNANANVNPDIDNDYWDSEKLDIKIPLIVALKNNNKEIAELLIKNGANIGQEDKNRKTALFYAREKGYQDIVELIVNNSSGLEPILLYACENGYEDIVKLLIKKDINLNTVTDSLDSDWYSYPGNPLNEACKKGYKEIVKLLLENGADPNIQIIQDSLPHETYVTMWSEFPLLSASTNHHREIVELLIEFGADINMRDYDGYDTLRTV